MSSIAGKAMLGLLGVSMAQPILGDVPIVSDILGGFGDIPLLGDLSGLSVYSSSNTAQANQPQTVTVGNGTAQGAQQFVYYPNQQPTSGFSTSTLLLVGGGLVAVLLLTRR